MIPLLLLAGGAFGFGMGTAKLVKDTKQVFYESPYADKSNTSYNSAGDQLFAGLDLPENFLSSATGSSSLKTTLIAGAIIGAAYLTFRGRK